MEGVGELVFGIEAIVYDDLLEGRVEAAELRAPRAGAPAQAGAAEASVEIFEIERCEHRLKVMSRSTRIVGDSPRAFAPDSRDMAARGKRKGKLGVEIAQLTGHAPA